MTVTKHKILITGASSQYGRLVIDALLEMGVPPSSLLLLTHDPDELAAYAADGAVVRRGSLDDDDDALVEAFAGVHTMLLNVSGSAHLQLPRHQAAVDAAVRAGAEHIVYTSIVSAHLEHPTASVARDHRATETMLKKSGLCWTALRCAPHAEAMMMMVDVTTTTTTTTMRSNAGGGKTAFVGRADSAAAAARVLSNPGVHRNRAYGITGPELLSWRDVAGAVGEAVGRRVVFEPLTDEEQLEEVQQQQQQQQQQREGHQGVGEYSCDGAAMVSFTKAVRLGEMAVISDDLEELTGVKPKSFGEICRERLQQARGMAE